MSESERRSVQDKEGRTIVYDVVTSFDFTDGGLGLAGAGAAGALERYRDAPTELRASIGETGLLEAEGGGGEGGEPRGRAPQGDAGAAADYVALPTAERWEAQLTPQQQQQQQLLLEQQQAEERRRAAAAAAAADESGDPPWWPLKGGRAMRHTASATLRLHKEVVDFCRFCEPTAEEAAARSAALARVAAVVARIWPGSRLEVFGSFATGLYLPGSDVDAVILGSGCAAAADGLRALCLALAREGGARKVALIAKARIPIVRFEETPSGFAFDVSFEMPSGPVAAGYVREQMARLPPLRPLSMVLKAFLQQRGLNEVYSGGVGSYALLVMLICSLRTHALRSGRTDCGAPEGNLGVLLLDFFELYGRQLECHRAGVSVDGFFAKAEAGMVDEARPELLAVRDPSDPANDLGRNSFNARAIRSAFDYAARLLQAPVRERSESLLRRVVQLDEALLGRPRLQAPGRIAAVGAGGAGLVEKGKKRKGKRERKAGRARGGAEEEEEEGEAPEEGEAEEGERPGKKRRRRRGGADEAAGREGGGGRDEVPAVAPPPAGLAPPPRRGGPPPPPRHGRQPHEAQTVRYVDPSGQRK